MLKNESIVRDINDLLHSSINETVVPGFYSENQEQKLKLISHHLKSVMQLIGFDTHDQTIQGIPDRLANFYVNDIFRGMNPANKPAITLQENRSGYAEMIVEKNISLCSWCDFYFVPFTATVHIAYLMRGKTIPSPQLKQLLRYHSQKLQSKEKLTEEIASSLKDCLGIPDIAVIMENIQYHHEADRTNTANSSSITAHLAGKFQNEDTRRELFSFLK